MPHGRNEFVQGAKRATAREHSVDTCQQQSTTRFGIVTGQLGQFFVEVLKTQIDGQRLGVFFEDLLELRKIRWRQWGQQFNESRVQGLI